MMLGGDLAALVRAGEEAGLPRRPLVRTGLEVSVTGFSGFALDHDDQETCTAAVRKAIGSGVNYFDVAPAYGNGACGTKLGIALEGIDRKSYVLACKTPM